MQNVLKLQTFNSAYEEESEKNSSIYETRLFYTHITFTLYLHSWYINYPPKNFLMRDHSRIVPRHVFAYKLLHNYRTSLIEHPVYVDLERPRAYPIAFPSANL